MIFTLTLLYTRTPLWICVGSGTGAILNRRNIRFLGINSLKVLCMKNVSTQQRVTRPRAGHWTLTLCCLQNCSPTHGRPELITDTGLQNNIRQHICSTRRINLDISLCNVQNKTKITFHLRLVAQHSTAQHSTCKWLSYGPDPGHCKSADCPCTVS